MTEAPDKAALELAQRAGDDAYMASEENAVNDAITAAIRAYLASSACPVDAVGVQTDAMSDDEIAHWAQKHGAEVTWGLDAEFHHIIEFTAEALRAALTVGTGEASREELAAFMLRNSFATGHGDTFADLLSELEWQVKERAATGEAKP